MRKTPPPAPYPEAIEAIPPCPSAATGALAGVLSDAALALPAMMRAHELQKQAALVGFDWPDQKGPRAKIDEELCECDEAMADPLALEMEIGDLLFSVVNWARHLGVEPETALRGANARFSARFAVVEQLSGDQPLTAMSLDQLEALWQRAKQQT